jgi:hypothetical protein
MARSGAARVRVTAGREARAVNRARSRLTRARFFKRRIEWMVNMDETLLELGKWDALESNKICLLQDTHRPSQMHLYYVTSLDNYLQRISDFTTKSTGNRRFRR